ncbi:MAG: MFS transporter [Chloroflexi bacterium]|nr:MFS transporter [Chloroflexota bacterium]
MAAVLRRGRLGRVYYGWYIVAVFFLAECITAGAGTFTFSLYLKPMSQDLGWSLSALVAGVSIRGVLGALVVQPIVGRLMDRFGPRWIVATGALVAGAALISLAWLEHLWHWYLAYGAAGPLGFGLLGALISHATVAKWFIEKRGRATAIVSFGIGFGGFTMTPVTGLIIHTLGWRAAWVIFGSLMWLLLLPTALLILRRSPEDLGLLPDGKASMDERTTRGPAVAHEVSWTAAEALRTKTLWFMVMAFAANGMALSPILTHQAVYLSDLQFSEGVVTSTVTLFALISASAQLFWGRLAERYPIQRLVVLSFLIAAVGVLFLLALSVQPTLVFVALYLAVYGSTRAVAALTGLAYANYWGRGFLGTIRGTTAPFNIVNQIGGPLLAAFIYDVTGEYTIAFTLSIVLFLAAALLMVFARPPQRSPQPATA